MLGAMPDAAPTPPLAGVKVLDFTRNLPGPYASFLLASWGAEVIKVESPKGDPSRHQEPLFTWLCRGARSVMLDLRDDGSRPALEALLGWADVVLEGFRPGVMDRLGAGFARTKELNPSVVYCSISAFGQTGPRRDEPGHDLNLQALTGVCHLERDASGTPGVSAIPVADLSSSLLAVSAIAAALAARARDGEGRHLDVAMADAVLSWSAVWGEGIDMGGLARRALARQGPVAARLAEPLGAMLDRTKLFVLPHYGVFRCRDGKHLALGVVDEGHFWKSLCRVLGLPRRMAGLSMPLRTVLGPVLRPAVAARLRTRSRDAWLADLEAAGVPATPVLASRETRQEPQFVARGMFGPDGAVRAPLPGARPLVGPAPGLGEHTDQILAELGVTSAGSRLTAS
jgi:crotonobetainyl-CoA:carnitine CoA-transferase CaiB-like acyl-CoA transferase